MTGSYADRHNPSRIPNGPATLPTRPHRLEKKNNSPPLLSLFYTLCIRPSDNGNMNGNWVTFQGFSDILQEICWSVIQPEIGRFRSYAYPP